MLAHRIGVGRALSHPFLAIKALGAVLVVFIPK